MRFSLFVLALFALLIAGCANKSKDPAVFSQIDSVVRTLSVADSDLEDVTVRRGDGITYVEYRDLRFYISICLASEDSTAKFGGDPHDEVSAARYVLKEDGRGFLEEGHWTAEDLRLSGDSRLAFDRVAGRAINRVLY
ncbi:MAG: hypothetical protein ABIH41_06020 [Nanoarchaeota archaeon]